VENVVDCSRVFFAEVMKEICRVDENISCFSVFGTSDDDVVNGEVHLVEGQVKL
jgi:hypothetical protein